MSLKIFQTHYMGAPFFCWPGLFEFSFTLRVGVLNEVQRLCSLSPCSRAGRPELTSGRHSRHPRSQVLAKSCMRNASEMGLLPPPSLFWPRSCTYIHVLCKFSQNRCIRLPQMCAVSASLVPVGFNAETMSSEKAHFPEMETHT